MMRGIWRVGSPDITGTQRLHLLILFLFHYLYTHSQWRHDATVLPTNNSEVAVSSHVGLPLHCGQCGGKSVDVQLWRTELP